ncbi:uncharacterized protein DNG_06096 [Cephalotrichum gorgonifer]|uniref:Uncharacterized protein n=1 Tax=Cephalotrichum gorgonifer TaxID=2041049 RepID=A0AAE8N1L5_9PEZI|nr:uncharacterized protein DNG_06096 [Cephalotrichum gorgonifer]
MSSADDPPLDLTASDIEPIPEAPLTPPPPAAASPVFTSPGSLHRLGISPFAHQFSPSPLRAAPSPGKSEQLQEGGEAGRRSSGSSYTTTSSSSSSGRDDDDLTRDNRDVLVQRLADLMERVGGGAGDAFDDESVSALHGKVDEMEDVIKGAAAAAPRAGKPRHPARPRHRPRSLDIDSTRDTAFWGGPSLGPSAILRSGLSDPSHMAASARFDMFDRSRFPARRPPGDGHYDDTMPIRLPALIGIGMKNSGPGSKRGGTISAEDAARISREAEQLNFHLATLITRFHARQEESEHIHALLIERAERAAQRIIALGEQVQDLTLSLEETNSDLSNLRIALKAIELQCPPPHDLDENLRQSIQNWKADWKRIKEARAARLGRRNSSLLSSPRTPRTPGTPW